MATREQLLQRALLETSLKLGPEANALRALLSQMAGNYSRTRKVNASNAAGIAEATRQARPQVDAAFSQALASSQAQRGALGVSGVEPQAAAYERRVMEQKANALTALSDRESRAMEGKVFANQQARDEYLGGKQKIVSELQSLAGQQGSMTAARLAQLEDEESDRALRARGQDITVRGQDIASRDRRAAREQRARDRQASAKGVKWATQQQHASAKDSIEKARALIQQQRARGRTNRADLVRLLVSGRAAQTVEVDGEKVQLPAIPALGADYVRAAMNLEFDGSLSRGDLKRLHDRRLQLRRLGYEVRPPQRRRRQSTAQLAATGDSSMSARPPVPGLSR